jgi:hypothetical protein
MGPRGVGLGCANTTIRLKRERIQWVIEKGAVGAGVAVRKGLLQAARADRPAPAVARGSGTIIAIIVAMTLAFFRRAFM